MKRDTCTELSQSQKKNYTCLTEPIENLPIPWSRSGLFHYNNKREIATDVLKSTEQKHFHSIFVFFDSIVDRLHAGDEAHKPAIHSDLKPITSNYRKTGVNGYNISSPTFYTWGFTKPTTFTPIFQLLLVMQGNHQQK